MIFFTSDPHYYHNNVIKYCGRPFTDINHMNEELISRWNNVVTDEDEVYMLGDFSMALRPVEIITPRLCGKKYLIPGNHDWCHSFNKKAKKHGIEKWIKFYEECGWIVLPEKVTLDFPNLGKVNLCHMPYDIADTRYQIHKMENNGLPLIHGHTHEKGFFNSKLKQLNVGVDVHGFAPVRLDVVIDIFDGNV